MQSFESEYHANLENEAITLRIAELRAKQGGRNGTEHASSSVDA